jgi:predicted permease
MWKSLFGGNPQMVGNTVELKGERHTIVGVLAPNAVTPAKADVFTPLRPAPTGECGGSNCGVLVRLKPGRTWPELNAQLKRIRLPFFDELETRYHGYAFLYARPLQLQLAGSMANRTVILMFAVSFILAIACANLAGLVLVRISRRTREIATLLALGATAFDVLRQLWLENLALAMIGGAGGVGITWLILSTLNGFLPGWMIPIGGFPLDGTVFAFAFGAALITSLLFGALPALRARRIGVRSSVAEGSRTVAGGSVRWRQWLIGAEVSLTVVLLAAAGLMVRTLIHLQSVPAGFDAHNILTAKVSLDDARYREENAFRALLEKSVSSMKQIPGVEEAAIGLSVPYERGLNTGFAILDGPRTGVESGASLAYVTNGYFSTLRIPLLSGRVFDDKDNPGSLPVAIVNLGFGNRFFNSSSPIGSHIRVSKTTYTIVGVVADVAKRPGMNANAPIGKEPVIYLPAVQTPQTLVNIAHIWFQPRWIVRTTGPVPGLTQSMQRALADADPRLPFAGFYSMEDILAEQLQLQRVEVVLFTTLAALALLLSAIGIYALVSNLVVQRRREIGIRIALGSGIQRIMVDVGGPGVIAAFLGVIAGFILSLAALRALSSEIYGTSANDPVTLASVMFVLTVTAIGASLLPTLRISRIHPAETLRAE